MSEKKQKEYDKVKKQIRSQYIAEIKGTISHIIDHKIKNKRKRKIYDEAVQNLIKENIVPDVSSVSENIAIIIDEEVVEIIHCQPRMAAMLLSDPTIVRIEKGQNAKIGWSYIDGKFIEKND